MSNDKFSGSQRVNMEHTEDQDRVLVRVTANVVAAYVGQNGLSAPDLPKLIGEVHQAWRREVRATEPAPELKPAVPTHQSVKKDHLVCLEDGKTFKSLKRHLRAEHGLSPSDYRERWGLPSDYPMVAPDYSATRSRLAKDMGLGGNVAAAPKKKRAR